MSVEALQSLLNLGVAGIMLVWFMARLERRLRGLERAVDQLTAVCALLALALEQEPRRTPGPDTHTPRPCKEEA